MKRHTLTFLFLAGCVDEVPELPAVSEAESASTSTQGASYQGASYQGASYQGASYQGASYQGASYQGTSYSGAVVAGASVSAAISKTSIILTRTLPNGTVERRTPTQKCMFPQNFMPPTCIFYNLATQKSPLAGATFATTFIQNGVPRAGLVKIRDVVGAVQADTWVAMHPLTGMGAGAQVACDHPSGTCGTNSDLYLYQVDLIDTDGIPYAFCGDGGKSMALAGTWDQTGRRTDLPGKLTFACTRGTIAKCTRWGYRPFGNGTDSGGTSQAMAPYHQACIRAATADYCANGTSFTKDGTLVDIYDYQPHQPGTYGFVPRTLSAVYQSSTALVWESSFDRHGATELDFTRYAELGSLYNTCPNTISLGTAPQPGEYHIPAMRDPQTWEAPWVSIDATSVCSHSEETLGRPLHPQCSKCTYHLWETFPTNPCVNGGPWNAACKQLALDNCHSPIYLGIYPRMALHSECTTGAALYKYDSACTMNLCGDPAYASCCSTGWTSACTAAANARCTGGREGVSPLGVASGFCGGSLPGGGGTIGGAVAP